MDYKFHYESLMNKARSRSDLCGYSERHHIVPKCMGGDDSKENIVRLTPEEHYLAHLILVKIHKGNSSLIWAAMNMTGKNRLQKRNNKIYGWVRRRLSTIVSETRTGIKLTEEHKKKLSDKKMGVSRGSHTEETRKKISASNKGKPKSESHKIAISLSKTGIKRGPHKTETIEKIRAANLGIKRDKSHMQEPAYRQLQSSKMAQIWELRRQGALPMPSRKKG